MTLEEENIKHDYEERFSISYIDGKMSSGKARQIAMLQVKEMYNISHQRLMEILSKRD